MTLAQAHQEPDDTNGNQRTPANPLFPSNSAPSPSPYAPPHFQGHLTLLPGLHLATPFEDHEVNLLAQKILRISIAIFVWSSLNTVRCSLHWGPISISTSQRDQTQAGPVVQHTDGIPPRVAAHRSYG